MKRMIKTTQKASGHFVFTYASSTKHSHPEISGRGDRRVNNPLIMTEGAENRKLVKIRTAEMILA